VTSFESGGRSDQPLPVLCWRCIEIRDRCSRFGGLDPTGNRAADELSLAEAHPASSRNSLSMVSSCSRYGDRHCRGGASTACLSLTKQLDAYGALSGALAVILSFVAEAKHVVLIHGSWSRGEQLAPARAAFEERGYTAHTPTLRHHELPSHEGAMKVASLSLRDYTDDLVAFVNSLDSPPLLVGHSMGGLVAQLVAARTRQAGLVAACPGPAAGTLGGTRTSLRMSLPHLLRPRSWTKSWRPPTFEQFRRWIANTQTEDIARKMYDGLVCESGRYLWELLLAVPRLSKATVVDFAAVTAPVLVMGAECDRIVPAGVVRRTAARYQHGTWLEIMSSPLTQRTRPVRRPRRLAWAWQPAPTTRPQSQRHDR
jgi:pimeloyl-ACP methyl ester carboxylesterase